MAETLISGAVRKFGEILGVLIAKEGSRLSELEENITWIRDEMRCIQFFLEDADKVESESRGLADFIRSIWDLAYDLEYIADEYFPELSSLTRNDWMGRLGWFLRAKTIRDFAVEIEKIRRRVQHMRDRRQIYHLPNASDSAGRKEWNPRKTFAHTEEVNVVGMDEHIEQLVAKVSDQVSEHRVISITGLAGLGKTTLARNIYNSVRQRFNCSAWICVSQEPNICELLREIAAQVGLTEEECKHNLEGKLFHSLRQKRYMIVIDDLWQIEHWDALKSGIPVYSMNGSRVIITSRKKDMCVKVGGQSFLHELQPLDEEKSRGLFFKVVMADPQDNDEDGDPSQLENIGEKILKKCGGVPLAIRVTAGLLLSKGRNIHAWKRVLESIGEDEDGYLKIFALSYKDLPSRLKPCFLYFGLFPEDYEIPAFQLINLWAAEGFIHGSGVRKVEDVGHDYVNQLVGRNLIQVVERRFNGTVRVCRIHDILHELCIRKAREMNFSNTLKNVPTSAHSPEPRRVVAYQSDKSDARDYASLDYQTSKLRAFLCSGDPEILSQVKLRLRDSKSLRVLIIRIFSWATRAPMNEIVKLKHLHHLQLSGCFVDLPYAISNLKNLLTLDLRLCGEVILPNVIWKMKELRHILLPLECCAPSVCGVNLDSHRFLPFEVSLPNLQTFRGLPVQIFEANWLHKLDSLRELKVYFTTEEIIEVLSSANLLSERLEKLYLTSLKYTKANMPRTGGLFPKFRSTLDLSKYVSLGKLVVCGSGIVDFSRHEDLPTCLTKLVLHATKLEMDPMVTLKKLPRLKILMFRIRSYCGTGMACTGEADSFPQLNVLKINSSGLEEFVAEEGAMLKLKNLTLSKRIKGMRVPDRIRNIIAIDAFDRDIRCR